MDSGGVYVIIMDGRGDFVPTAMTRSVTTVMETLKIHGNIP